MTTGSVPGFLRHLSCAGAMRGPASAATVRSEMQRRPAKTVYDYLSPTPSVLLSNSLSDFVPPAALAAPGDGDRGTGRPLPLGHHLVYFPLQLPPSRLLADGTDPGHSPGPAFSRRMWAGGSIVFSPGWRDALRLDGRRAVCVESIGDVAERPGRQNSDSPDGRFFVDVWRRYGPVGSHQAGSAAENEVGRRPAIEERRTLVFMQPAATMSPAGMAINRRAVRGEHPVLSCLCLPRGVDRTGETFRGSSRAS